MLPRSFFLLPFLCALNLCPAQTIPADPQREAMAGQRLNAAEVMALEAAVAKQPDDLSPRTKLLGYYFMRQYSSPEAKAARRPHIFWIIKNQPAAMIASLPYCNLDPDIDNDAYAQGKALWLQQTRAQATNTAVLGNAAQFFQLHDRDLAEGLLKQAQKAEPNNPKWSEQLGHLYALPNQDGKADAAKSLQEFERAQAADPDASSRFNRLDKLATQAFEAGDLKQASLYANDLLAAAPEHLKDWNYGNAIHTGNTVLGRIALRQGQIKPAKEYLLKAGQTLGSPQLHSFGPNMSLAKELAEKGETDVVVEYLDLCRKFWSMGDKNLDKWTKEVRAGIAPDFGANLLY
jgi:hypothetical protein